MKQYYLPIIALLALCLLATIWIWPRQQITTPSALVVSPTLQPTPAIQTTPRVSITPSPSPVTTPAASPLPAEVKLAVPFLVQAPLANWDTAHGEACEEASLIMLNHFARHTTIPSPAAGDKEILDLIDYETQHGYAQDITLRELASIAKDYYKLEGTVHSNPTIDDIKRELDGGRPVIIPAAGRLLGNPNFRQPGPIYHMLVITGYDGRGFITNDPGTRHGENYRYTFDVILNAIHDWNKNDILQGEKAYFVLAESSSAP